MSEILRHLSEVRSPIIPKEGLSGGNERSINLFLVPFI